MVAHTFNCSFGLVNFCEFKVNLVFIAGVVDWPGFHSEICLKQNKTKLLVKTPS